MLNAVQMWWRMLHRILLSRNSSQTSSKILKWPSLIFMSALKTAPLTQRSRSLLESLCVNFPSGSVWLLLFIGHFHISFLIVILQVCVNMTLPTFPAVHHAVVSLLLRTSACYCLMPPTHWALSSKPAACRFCWRTMGQTDGQTDGRLTVLQTLLCILCGQYDTVYVPSLMGLVVGTEHLWLVLSFFQLWPDLVKMFSNQPHYCIDSGIVTFLCHDSTKLFRAVLLCVYLSIFWCQHQYIHSV